MHVTRTMAALLLLAGWTVSAAAQDRCENCGKVESVRSFTTRQSWTPLGSMPSTSERATAGQVSTQYNFTSGNVVLLGAAGGAGYAKRPDSYDRPRWEVAVLMNDGSRRTVTTDYEPVLQPGDRVRVYGRQIELE